MAQICEAFLRVDQKSTRRIAMAIGRLTEGVVDTVIGVMLESNLVAGQSLVYGQSITDAGIGWDETLPLLRELATAVPSARSSR